MLRYFMFRRDSDISCSDISWHIWKWFFIFAFQNQKFQRLNEKEKGWFLKLFSLVRGGLAGTVTCQNPVRFNRWNYYIPFKINIY